jgi:hypothetical protein
VRKDFQSRPSKNKIGAPVPSEVPMKRFIEGEDTPEAPKAYSRAQAETTS